MTKRILNNKYLQNKIVGKELLKKNMTKLHAAEESS